jgi:hypothetical protein
MQAAPPEVPQTNTEYLVFILILLCSICVFAYSVTVLGEILSEAKRFMQMYNHQSMIINRYMNKKGLSFNLRLRIRDYLKYNFELQNITKDDRRRTRNHFDSVREFAERDYQGKQRETAQVDTLFQKLLGKDAGEGLIYRLEEISFSGWRSDHESGRD